MITNALRIQYQNGVTWVEDAASIALYGRVEGSASYPVETSAAAEELGELWLATHAFPAESNVFRLAEGATKVIGTDMLVGDTAVIAGETERLVEVRWDVDPDLGVVRATAPGFQSQLNTRRIENATKIDQIVAAEGGSSAGSARVRPGPGEIVGKLQERSLQSWSTWEDDLEVGEIWQAAPVDAPTRISRIVLLSGDISAATTETRLRLIIDGAEALTGPDFGSIPTDAVISSAEFADDVEVYGHTVLGKGSTYGVKLIGYGGHNRLSIVMFGSDPL